MQKDMLFKAFMLGMLVSVMSFASNNAAGNITSAMQSLRDLFCNILPIAIGATVALAAVIFAAGQMLGAETRARMKVWATNLVIGAAMGVLVYVLVPWLLDMIAPGQGFGTMCSP